MDKSIYHSNTYRKTLACWLASLFFCLPIAAQQHFHRQMPPGNYSGICPIGNDRYAVVSDKSEEDGFFIFHMTIDTLRHRITNFSNEGYRSSGLPNRDMEGICFFPPAQTLFISGETDNEVYEYNLNGQRTGRKLNMPDAFHRASRNYGFESLTYDTERHLFYTTTEHPLPGDSLHRIQSFSDDLQPARQWLYKPDAPLSPSHIHGISELCAIGDGRLLVIERQVHVPRMKIGATCTVRIYEVMLDKSQFLQKRLLKEIRTRLTVTDRHFANFEGMCQPTPGTLLLIADSQNRLRGVLRDWFQVLDLSGMLQPE